MKTIIGNSKFKCVNKPARYTGGEVNQIIKDENKVESNVVLCYPSVYEKGMSNYYFKLLYSNLNLLENIYCTRCFACDIDFEQLLKSENYELYSLENKKSIRQSDLIIFIMDDELNFTNFINMLNLANIPISKEDRKNIMPKIAIFSLNGTNIKPIYDFVDIVFDNSNIQENIKELLKYVKEFKNNVDGTNEFIQIECPINSIVPSIKIENLSIIIDLETVINIDDIVEYIRKCISAQGITKVSFINQDKIDSYKFCELVYKIKTNIDDVRISVKGIDFSLFEDDALQILLQCMEKSTLEFRIITCSKKLMSKINTGIDREEILNKISCIFKNGWSSIKCIFNIGIPEETYEDIDNIFDLAGEIVNMYSKYRAKDKLSIIFKFNCYIPKIEEKSIYNVNNINKLETKIRYINEKEIDSAVKVNVENSDIYINKCLLKNGDRSISNVILSAYNLGARFDNDILKYNKNAWNKAIFDNDVITMKYTKSND